VVGEGGEGEYEWEGEEEEGGAEVADGTAYEDEVEEDVDGGGNVFQVSVEGRVREDRIALVCVDKIVFVHVVCRCGSFRRLCVRRYSGLKMKGESMGGPSCREKFDLLQVPTLLRQLPRRKATVIIAACVCHPV
jgi:hypothetical protein